LSTGDLSISVVIPTFRRDALLRRAIDSVLNQTDPADELIVVDDGSLDGTIERLRQRYGDAIHCERLADNRGVSAARNHGIARARGAWIALLDADDAWLPEKLERQRRALRSAPTYRLCHTDELWVRHGRRVNPMDKHRKAGGEIFLRCLPRCAISPSSVMLSRQLLEEVGLFDTALPACEDYDLWLRVCAREPVLYLDQPLLIKYGGHTDQLSRRYYGLDRFRVAALEKLLNTTPLTTEQRRAARRMLLEKLDVIIGGAERRDRAALAQRYRAKRLRWEAR
jgi:glycosyltransferase involved in cell wall biosynthesis